MDLAVRFQRSQRLESKKAAIGRPNRGKHVLRDVTMADDNGDINGGNRSNALLYFEVDGLETYAGKAVKFLRRKRVNFSKYKDVEKFKMLLALFERSRSQLLKLDGTTMNNRKVSVREITKEEFENFTNTSKSAENSPSKVVNTTMEVLRQFLMQRWNEDSKMLDISRMSIEPTLQSINYNELKGSTRMKFYTALFKLASETFPDIVSINLASNLIENLYPLKSLCDFCPKVQNISLMDNKVNSWKEFDAWTKKPAPNLRNLQELIVLGNPISDKSTSREHYEEKAVRHFPHLKLLDGSPVKISAKQDDSDIDKAMNSFRKPSFADSDITRNIANGFCARYFNLFDKDRNSEEMISMYSEDANFSCSLANRLGSYRGLKNWRSVSRNMKTILSKDRLESRLSIGRTQISEALKNLPSTQHKLVHQDDVIFDALAIDDFGPGSKQAIQIFIQGSAKFGEDSLSFSRTFILGSIQNSIFILSDLLLIRKCDKDRAWAPKYQRVDEKDAIICDLSTKTSLNLRYAKMCLEQNEWNLGKALLAFQALHEKGAIPQEAFL